MMSNQEQRTPDAVSIPVSLHPCVVEVNEHLGKFNTRLDIGLSFTLSNIEQEREVIMVATAKLDSKKRTSARKVFATFCPFCGAKL
jgi:hypothetical protein